MKIGLYFGSFNPIHVGHLIIANYLANNSSFDQIWLIISPQNPLKPQRSLLNEYQRKHLVDISIEGEKKLRSSSIEFSLPKPSYTIDTLSYLHEKYPDHEFSIIMGSDSYANIEKWKNYKKILSDYDIYIYSRPGVYSNSKKSDRSVFLDAPLLDISSTMIRSLIMQKKSIRYLVPDVVKEEIEANNYYKLKDPS